jgi:hypothetical protein
VNVHHAVCTLVDEDDARTCVGEASADGRAVNNYRLGRKRQQLS